MKQSEINEALVSLWVLVRESSPIIIGSQALHGKYPDMADDIMYSREVDVILPNKSRLGRWLNEVVGDGTPYAVDRGYHIDHVMPVEGLPIFAADWEDRLVKRALATSCAGEQVLAGYLSPEDLVICKLGAGRPKDMEFVQALVQRRLVDLKAIDLLAQKVPSAYREKINRGLSAIRERIVEVAPRPRPAH